jgi:hypothetical protein
MVGSVIGGSSPSDLRKGQADLLWDGRLSKNVRINKINHNIYIY